MKVAVFNTKAYDQKFLTEANRDWNHQLQFFEPRLTPETAPLAQDFPAVCVFVNDQLDRKTLTSLQQGGTNLIALRCAGYNNVDMSAATDLDLSVVRVPAYSPHAVAEHAIALMLCINRKLHRAYNRTKENNFSLNGLLGFDLYGKTIGIIGTGRIGSIVSSILLGFGCRVIAYDLHRVEELKDKGVIYVELDELVGNADIISLHCPLTSDTYHMIDRARVDQMKPGAMLVNTSRGGLVDTQAIIDGLKSRKIGYLALDVYEEEEDLFFQDLSDEVIEDDIFQRLLTFPNVIITAHQAFFTQEALDQIAQTTLSNIAQVEQGKDCPNQVSDQS